MAQENEEVALTIYGTNLESQLAKIRGGMPFEWNSKLRRKKAEECFEAALLAADIGIKGQVKLQLREVLKETFADFLEPHRVSVTFAGQIRYSHPVDTYEILIPPEIFSLIKVLEEYPFQWVFGQEELSLSSLRIAEREKKGEFILEVVFLDETCAISVKST